MIRERTRSSASAGKANPEVCFRHRHDIIFSVVLESCIQLEHALCNCLFRRRSFELIGELSDSDEEDSAFNSADDIQPFEGCLATRLSQTSTSIDDLDTSGSLTDSDDDAIGQRSQTDLKVSPKHGGGKSKKSQRRKKSREHRKPDTGKRNKSK